MRKKHNLKSFIMATTIIVAGALTFIGCGNESGAAKSDEKEAKKIVVDSEVYDGQNEELLTGKHHVKINVKDYGTIDVELDADTAPITVTNFVNLSKDGFYNGLTFHRIIDGFMIQGGDPLGNGTGGSDKYIKGEFEQNGVTNTIEHKRGVISMARANDYDSASSQFFIMQSDAPHLDGMYAAFGNVTSGMEIVDKICKDVEVQDANGTTLSEDQPVIESVEVVD